MRKKEKEESVLLKLGKDYYAQVSKTKACDLLARRMEKIVLPDTNDNSGKMTSTVAKTKKKKKKPVQKDAKPAPIPPTNNLPKKEVVEEEAEPSLPFFEIREHFDQDGNEIRTETINMTNELKHLKQKIQQQAKQKGNDDDEDDKEVAKVSQSVHDELEDMMQSMNTSMTTTNDTIEADSSKINEEEEEKYKKISSRLEELMKLEEEDNKKKKSNIKSSKKLQSKGWNKGFLNNDKNKKKKKKSPVVKESAFTSSSLSDATIPPSEATTKSKRATSAARVSFSEKNEVKEIPRIGTLPLPPKNNSGRSIGTNINDKKDKKINKPPPKPIDQNVFSGVVSERPASRKQQQSSTSKSRFKMQQTKKNADNVPSLFMLDRLEQQEQKDNDGIMSEMVIGGIGEYHVQNVTQMEEQQQQRQPPTVKKVSRFAQRRQQQKQ